MQTPKLPVTCPSCLHSLHVSQLSCPSCSTQVSGNYSSCITTASGRRSGFYPAIFSYRWQP